MMATRPGGCTMSQQSAPTSLNEQAQGDFFTLLA